MAASNLITFTFKQSTATSVTLTGTKTDMVGAEATISLTNGPETVEYLVLMGVELEKDFTITGLSPGTTYTVTYSGEVTPSGNVTSVTTLADEPRTATESQWADLANRVKTLGARITAISNYSTSEQNTGFTWVDGKHIYKKTISLGTLPNNTEKIVNHNISNLDWVVDIECFAKDGLGNKLVLPTPSASPITLNVRNSDIVIVTTSDRSSYTQTYCTIYYTKSN